MACTRFPVSLRARETRKREGRTMGIPKVATESGKACIKCGKRLAASAHDNQCASCRAKDRECAVCGRQFKGNHKRCLSCRSQARVCTDCGTSFKGSTLKCWACRTPGRTCDTCGVSFRGQHGTCGRCRYRILLAVRTCTSCGRSFNGTQSRCKPCYYQSLPDRGRSIWEPGNRRARARRRGAQPGSLDSSVYEHVRQSGPCVYCGASATSVDHVRPLARDGHEVETNLVPACGPCNSSKHHRLLTEWRPDRVAHAVAVSPLVRAEYERQVAEANKVAA